MSLLYEQGLQYGVFMEFMGCGCLWESIIVVCEYFNLYFEACPQFERGFSIWWRSYYAQDVHIQSYGAYTLWQIACTRDEP